MYSGFRNSAGPTATDRRVSSPQQQLHHNTSEDVQNIERKIYEDRLASVVSDVAAFMREVQGDEVILQMGKDESSSHHIQERILELWRNFLSNDQEKQIHHLSQQVSSLTTEVNECYRKVEEISNSYMNLEVKYAEQTQDLIDAEEKINHYKLKYRDVTNKNAETKTLQEKAKKDVKKYSSKVSELHERQESLEQEVKQRDEHIEKMKTELEALKQIKDDAFKTAEQKNQVRFELEKAEEMISELKRSKKELKVENENLTEMLSKSEQERLEIRKLYLSISEKVMTAMKSGDSNNFYHRFENIFDTLFGSEGVVIESLMKGDDNQQGDSGIYFLKQKLKDLQGKLNDEIRSHRNVQKVQKKKFKECEEALDIKSKELNEATSLIAKLQAKLEKYKSKSDEETRYRQKIETNYKRTVSELEYALAREKKSHDELQEEFNKKVSSRSEDVEKRVRDQYESKIFALQREVADKEQQLQKNNLQQMIQTQLNVQAKPSIHPENVEKLLDIYESKFALYQKDYILRSDHEQKIRDLETKYSLERKELIFKSETEIDEKLKQLEERKNKEFNFTLNNIKQAVKSLETSLEQEKRNSEKLAERLEIQMKNEENMKFTMREMEENKGVVLHHLEEATSNVSKLKDLLETETKKRREVQQQYEKCLSDIQRMQKTLEESKLHNDTLERVIKSNKQEIGQLKDAVEKEKERHSEIAEANKDVSATVQSLEADRRKLIDTIQSIIQYAKFKKVDDLSNKKSTRYSSDEYAVEELCKELNQGIIDMKDGYERALENLQIEINNEKRKIDHAKWQRKQKSHKSEIMLRERVATLRKEINLIRATAEKEMLNMKHLVEKQMEMIIRKANEQGIRSSEIMNEMKRGYEEENEMLKSQYKDKMKQKQGEIRQTLLEYQQSITSLEERLRLTTTEKNTNEIENNKLLRKFEHFKKTVQILASFLHISIDIQNDLLSLQDSVPERGLVALGTFLEKLEKDAEDQTEEIRQLTTKLNLSVDECNSLRQLNHGFKEELNKIKHQNLSMSQTQKQNSETYQNELKNLYQTVEVIQQKHKDELNKYSSQRESIVKEMKENYEKKLEGLQAKMTEQNSKVVEITKERQKLIVELEKVKLQLDVTMKELEKKKQDIKQMTEQNQQSILQEGNIIKELKRKLEDKEKQLILQEEKINHFNEKLQKRQKQLESLQGTISSMKGVNSTVDSAVNAGLKSFLAKENEKKLFN